MIYEKYLINKGLFDRCPVKKKNSDDGKGIEKCMKKNKK
jgi:hypothetical protein